MTFAIGYWNARIAKRATAKCVGSRTTWNIFVDEMGNLIKPGYITDGFARLLRDNHLRSIRFHDLRHSCASLLLTGGVPMKQIQEWLGHSDFSTTANIYAHLDYSSKITTAEAMLVGLDMS